ncbi:glycosyl transferase [Aquicoccus sp. SCR17]|nr:glycosyl transferase [Carideicomes alvinocaridis]
MRLDQSRGRKDGGPAPSRKARIEVFGFDVAEISQVRRIRALMSLGHEVHSFTMSRGNMAPGDAPDWPNTHLFHTVNENLPRRAAVVAGSVARMARHRRRLQAADLIIARNLDMLAIAWAARAMAGAGHVPLVYECLDIHGALCRADAAGRAMRAAERALLDRIAMLVVSSPGFVRDYFGPVQAYRGPWALWENRLAAGAELPPRPTMVAAPGGPLRLGWVGTIRCGPSLALLAEVADRMGPAVEIRIHGVVHRHALPEFDAVVGARRNMSFHGPYRYPQDLPAIYGGCDLVWAQDLWQRGGNSDWLLPNRIYEAGWAGCPAIAVAGTETGRRVAGDGLGWVLPQARAEALAALLARLGREEIAARRRSLLQRPAGAFVQDGAEIEAVIARLVGGGTGARAA